MTFMSCVREYNWNHYSIIQKHRRWFTTYVNICYENYTMSENLQQKQCVLPKNAWILCFNSILSTLIWNTIHQTCTSRQHESMATWAEVVCISIVSYMTVPLITLAGVTVYISPVTRGIHIIAVTLSAHTRSWEQRQKHCIFTQH